MGLAASQARLLMLTARKSDIEFRGQTLNNRRMALTYKMEKMATEYSDALANRSLKIMIGDAKKGKVATEFDKTYLSSYDNYLAGGNMDGELPFFLIDSSGNAVEDSQLSKMSSEEIELKLRQGILHFSGGQEMKDEHNNPIAGKYVPGIDWRSDGTGTFKDTYDETDDELARAKYEADSTKIQGEDKRLEMELKQLDSEHKAVQTEVDAVKKVIDKNIQKSFKTFG